jgi:hypothetical protein
VTSALPSVGYQPSGPELRMLAAVARQSICDAWQRGEDRSVFHGYCIETKRIKTRHIGTADDGHPLLVLTLRAAGAAGVLDRLFIAVASHPSPGSAWHISFDGVRAFPPCRTKSLVGCVSPSDARHASP